LFENPLFFFENHCHLKKFYIFVVSVTNLLIIYK